MFDNPQSTHVMGLDLDYPSLKGVVLGFSRGKPSVVTTFDYPIEPITPTTDHVKPLYTAEEKSQLENFLHKNLVVTAMGTQDTLVRPLDLKVSKEKDIDAVLAFQAEPLLPYPIDNAIVEKITLQRDKEGSKLTVTAIRKDHMAQHLKLWNSLDVEPEVVSTTPYALALFAHYFTRYDDPYLVLHVGLSQSTCILLDKGKLIAAQAIPMGLETLAEALAKDASIDLSNARQTIYTSFQNPPNTDSELSKTLDSLRLAIMRTTYALSKQLKGKEVTSLLTVGPGSIIPALIETVCGPLGKKTLPLTQDPSFDISLSDLQKFALPIGAALSALPMKFEQINFRQGDFTYPSPWRRLQRPMAIYIALCVGIAIAILIFGQSYNRYEEAMIKQQYIDLLTVVNKPYADFEKEIVAKANPKLDLATYEVPSVATLTTAEIRQRLNLLEKEIQATPQTYPLKPEVPLVSDVLAWLGSHPKFVGTPTSDGEMPASLKIESFSYTMVKRPEPTKKQDKYQVKIELEFSSPTPKMAREFHDALIAPNDFVDPKGEIKWNSNRDRYRTSFYLKDKTTYPSL